MSDFEFDTIGPISQAEDYLIVGDFPREPGKGTLITGQDLTRGAVLGKITLLAGTAVPDAGNTGDGAVSGFALAAGGPAIIGGYIATCIATATDAGTFEIKDPNGSVVGTMEVGTTFTGAGITFAIADGATDFALDDFVTFPVEAGSDKLTIVDKDATDGSQIPYMVLTRDTDATSADKKCPGYKTGDFNIGKLSFAVGTAYADVSELMESKNMYGHSTTPAP